MLRFAAARKYRLISIGYANDWVDEQELAAGPEAFASLMAGSAAVVTNFFHGCVFALLNAKPFACVSSDYRSNKVHDLTRSLGAEKHLIDETAVRTLAELLEAPLEAIVFSRIASLRRQSSAYLAAAIA